MGHPRDERSQPQGCHPPRRQHWGKGCLHLCPLCRGACSQQDLGAGGRDRPRTIPCPRGSLAATGRGSRTDRKRTRTNNLTEQRHQIPPSHLPRANPPARGALCAAWPAQPHSTTVVPQSTPGTTVVSMGRSLTNGSRSGRCPSICGVPITASQEHLGAEPAAPPAPREPRGAAPGGFIAGIAAGLLGFAGCSPGSLIPPIIYPIQTLCRAAVIAGELPRCLTINISSRVPGTRLCRSRPHRVAHALSRTLAAAAPETCAQRVRVSGCDTPTSTPCVPPGSWHVAPVMGWGEDAPRSRSWQGDGTRQRPGNVTVRG